MAYSYQEKKTQQLIVAEEKEIEVVQRRRLIEVFVSDTLQSYVRVMEPRMYLFSGLRLRSNTRVRYSLAHTLHQPTRMNPCSLTSHITHDKTRGIR